MRYSFPVALPRVSDAAGCSFGCVDNIMLAKVTARHSSQLLEGFTIE